MKKRIVISGIALVLFAGLVAFLATSNTALATFSRSQSSPVVIALDEPIDVALLSVESKGHRTDGDTFRIYPGRLIFFTYRIENKASMDYVLEITSSFQGDFRTPPEWQFQDMEGESEINPQGPAHIRMPAESVTTVTLVVAFPKGSSSTGTQAELVLHANRINCERVTGCPWG